MELSEIEKSKNEIANSFSFKNYKVIILDFTLCFISLIIQIYSCVRFRNYISAKWLFISSVVLFIYFIITIISLFRTRKLEKTIQELDIEKINYKSLSLQYDDISCIKHDFNNIVQNVGNYIALNDFESLKAYYKGISEECAKTKSLGFLNSEYISNPNILGVLSKKYYEADRLNINVHINVFSNLDNLSIDSFNLTRILDILLDNAICASSQCENKIINIELSSDRRLEKSIIVIENTYANKNIDINKIFDKGYSSKKHDKLKSHGLGLWKVKQILEKYKNLNLHTSKNDQFFRQELEIYN